MPSGNEYYQNISEPIIDIYAQIETDLLENIAKKLGEKSSLINKIEADNDLQLILEWQTKLLDETSALTKENAKIITNLSELSESKISGIFEDAAQFQTRESEAKFQGAINAGVPLSEVGPIADSESIKRILNSAINATNTTFKSVDMTMLTQATIAYTATINKISAQVLSGTKSSSAALGQAITNLSKEGITGFINTAGSKMSGEAYSALVMRANTKNTVTAIQEARAIAYGNDHIEINAYSGARPKCTIDQGRIYSRSGSSEPVEDLDGNKIPVIPWGDSSFGEPDGILGINCGHQRFDFMAGYSTQDKEKINQRENTRSYKEKQLQRKYERDIRNAKREKAMLKSGKAPADNIQKAQSKISRRQEIMREFIKETDRTRRPARERIGIPS